MAEPSTICLVSPGHFSSNPRLVKEAAALLNEGFEVATVTSGQIPWFTRLDQRMPLVARFKTSRLVRLGGIWRRLMRLRQMAYRRWVQMLFAWGRVPSSWQLAEALNLDCRRLRKALELHQSGAAGPFDLIIAHNLAALPAAAAVAHSAGCPYAFDAEDSHVDELYPEARLERQIRAGIERALLPGASYISASSAEIGAALSARYGVSTHTQLNVFDSPLKLPPERPALKSAEPLRFFWFSQTLGPDRGLDQFLLRAKAIVQGLGRAVELTLVGRPTTGFDLELRHQATLAGITLNLKELVPPDELFALAASHHCGLALEHPSPVNKDLCLANKIFTYLAAGIPVLLTPTTAHRNLYPALAGAALLLEQNLSDEALVDWLEQTVCPGQGAAAARKHYRERYNWAQESRGFIQRVRGVIGQ